MTRGNDRLICSWCPTELPNDPYEWRHHFVIAHHDYGYSVHTYPALTIEEEMDALVKGVED